ncbi:hypothetical protein [Streptomyces sp. NPDC002889]|uniref:hypothetical protein n=1 Tax=Streptomyces sp. NPDC002889 TaxID=3364669 RepID=UPI0036B0311B
MVTARHKHGVAALSGAVALAAVLAGCSGSNDGDSKPSQGVSTPAPATSSADPQAAEKAAVLKAYEGLTAAEARTYATAKLDPELEKYAAHKALSDIKVTLFYHQQQGTVMKGDVTRKPDVTALNTESEPLKAVVTDCADSSRYDEVNAKTGKVKELKSPGPRRHVVTATAQRSKSGAWVFYTYTIERGRTC